MSLKLTKQLNILSQIRPDHEWQTRSRDILLSQIRRGQVEKESGWFSFIETPAIRNILFVMTQPVMLTAVFLLALIGGSYLSVHAASQTKPGDALYIAKIISERTQFALTFDDSQKTKLNLSFATNRAEELQKVQAENKPEKEAQVAQLTTDLQSELAAAQTRIDQTVATPVVSAPKTVANKTVIKPVAKNDKADTSVVKSTVKSANLEKETIGIEYYDPRQLALQGIKDSLAKKDYEATADALKNLTSNIEQPEKIDIKKSTTTEDKKVEVKTGGLEKGTSSVPVESSK